MRIINICSLCADFGWMLWILGCQWNSFEFIQQFSMLLYCSGSMHDENYSKIFTMRSKFRHSQLCIVKTLIIWTSKWIWLNIYGKYKREKSAMLKKIPMDSAITLFTWTCFGVNKMRRPLHPLATRKKNRSEFILIFTAHRTFTEVYLLVRR